VRPTSLLCNLEVDFLNKVNLQISISERPMNHLAVFAIKYVPGCAQMQVIPGSPAARAGVSNDDVIVEFDGMPVTTINQVCILRGAM
jgi:S1-C subfamily serine protease